MLLGIGYAAAAASFAGLFLFVNKRYFGAYPSSAFVSLTFGLAAVLYLPVAALNGGPLPTETTTVAAIAGTVVCLAVGMLVLFQAVCLGEISYVAPLSKVTPAFVLPLEIVVVGQFVSRIQVVGVVVVTAAVYLVNYRRGTSLLAPIRAVLVRQPARLAVLSALVLAFMNVFQRVLLQELAVAPPTWAVAKIGGVALFLSPIAYRAWPPGLRPDLPRLAAAAAILVIAEHSIIQAFTVLPASVVTPISSTSAIVATVLGGVVLGEEALGKRLTAAALAAGGVALVALG